MKRIVIEIIPHAQQRYDTIGDWQFDQHGNLVIKISDLGDWRYNFLVARHEMDEAILCKWRGIAEKDVDNYDFTHPEAGGDSFSGSSDAPYYQEHCDALAAEWIMSRLLGVSWKDYDAALYKLSPEKNHVNETAVERPKQTD